MLGLGDSLLTHIRPSRATLRESTSLRPTMAFSFTRKEFPTADFELLANDGITLHVHRSLLEVASPFFQDMFSIPQPVSIPTFETPPTPGTNCVRITEDSKTMAILLSLVYPLPLPSTSTSANESEDILTHLASPQTSLHTLARLLSLSHKYIIPLATSKLTTILLQRAFTNPREEALKVYAIGCRYDMPELIKGGVRATWCVGEGGLLDLDGLDSRRGGKNPEGTVMHDQTEMHDEDAESEIEGEDAAPRLSNRPTRTVSRPPPDDILMQISAWDYQRLVRLHRLRSTYIKSLIISPSTLPPNLHLPASVSELSPLASPSPCPQCSSTAHFGLSLPAKWYITFQQLAPLEIDKSGPNVKRILSSEFLGECVGSGCARCGSSLMSRDGREWVEALRERVENLGEALEL